MQIWLSTLYTFALLPGATHLNKVIASRCHSSLLTPTICGESGEDILLHILCKESRLLEFLMSTEERSQSVAPNLNKTEIPVTCHAAL